MIYRVAIIILLTTVMILLNVISNLLHRLEHTEWELDIALRGQNQKYGQQDEVK